MKVTVNRTELDIFSGARVIDALRMYYSRHKKAMPAPLPTVKDIYGNTLDYEGRLKDGTKLKIKKNTL